MLDTTYKIALCAKDNRIESDKVKLMSTGDYVKVESFNINNLNKDSLKDLFKYRGVVIDLCGESNFDLEILARLGDRLNTSKVKPLVLVLDPVGAILMSTKFRKRITSSILVVSDKDTFFDFVKHSVSVDFVKSLF